MSQLFYLTPAKDWIEALPLGNGSIGAMVYGGVQKEVLCLNHDTLWSGRPQKIENEGAYDAFLEAKRFVFEEKYCEAHDTLTEKFLSKASEVYLPFGNMYLEFEMEDDVEDYIRCLDLKQALMTVQFKSNDVVYRREYFTSYPDEVLAIRLEADKKGKIHFKLSMDSQLQYETRAEETFYLLDGECPGDSHMGDAGWRTLTYEYPKEEEKKGVQFRGGVKVLNKGGSVFYSEDGIAVKGADSAVILLTIKTSFNGYNKLPAIEGREYKQKVKEVLATSEKFSWEELLEHHLRDYMPLFEKIKLDLGQSGFEDMPTDKRLQRFYENQDDISFYTLMFDFGRYLTIASSRENTQAANLQGIWNDSIRPPWSSNYTTNINLEMNYWPTLMCGLENCYEPYIRFAKERSEAGEHTAQHFYHARGFVMHHNSDIWAYTTPIAGNALFGFWHGASGWISNSLFQYYEYTLDKEYLEKTCYPIMKKAAQFYLDLLCERGDGYDSICPSTSAENFFTYDEEKVSAVAKYTTMSDCIAYELFENCLKAMKEIDCKEENFEKELKGALSRMNPIACGKDGRILEWNREFGEYWPQHRHVSHLYALHPAHMITPDKTPELAEGCRKVLEKRGDEGTGWCIVWKAAMYARLNDGNHALKLLNDQLRYATEKNVNIVGGGTYPNLFCAHPPFQIDGNFGFVSSVIEMLVDVRDGELHLLPALPEKWKNGRLIGVRIKGNRILDIEWKDGKLTDVREKRTDRCQKR